MSIAGAEERRIDSAKAVLGGFRRSTLIAVGVLALATCLRSDAQPTVIVDSAAATAIEDGTVNAGEYAGFSGGINMGFGDVVGSSSELHLDSDSAGALHIGHVGGGGPLNDVIVMYVDSVPGGFADLALLQDTADPHRQAISGLAGAGFADLSFAPGFAADYAIAWSSGFAGVWALAAGGDGSLLFQAAVSLTPTGNAAAGVWEMTTTLATIGLSPGDSFAYVVTLLNPGTMFRSDEFHGVAASTVPAGNPGSGSSVALASGDQNSFTSVVPVTLSHFSVE